MFYRKLFLTLAVCMLYSLLFAQQEQIQFSRINISGGLSHNQVNAILKDKKGFMWFGTLSGLNRYNGYEFKTFKHDPADTSTISDDFITRIFELPDDRLYLETKSGANVYDPQSERFIRDTRPYFKTLGINAPLILDVVKDVNGDFWFNADTEGIYKYSVATGKTLHLPCDGKKQLAVSRVSAIQKGINHDIWVIHRDKTLEVIDSRSGKVSRRLTLFQEKQSDVNNDYRLFVDRAGCLWIYALNSLNGIDFYNPATCEKRLINKRNGGLNNNLIYSVIQDPKGMIWIATDHGGVNLLDKKDFTIRYLLHREDDPKSIGQNSVLSLYKDPSGIMWLGTFKQGVSFFQDKILKFPLFRHQADHPEGLGYEDVNRFAEDDKGNIWIGTNGGGLFYFNRKTGKFKRYRHETANPASLSNDIIVSLYIDRQQTLWIGTYYGGLNSFDGKKFRTYKHTETDPSSLTDDRVWDILEDKKGNLWVGTLRGGLDRMDRKKATFIHHKAGGPNSIGSNNISCLLEDRDGNLWVGTSEGVDQISPSGKVHHYQNRPQDIKSLVNNTVYDLMQDSYGFIWVATRDGLSRLDPQTGDCRNFDQKDGLTERATLKIVEDPAKNLWLSTANGLFNVLVQKDQHGGFSYVFRRYDAADGLQGNAFNANAGYKTRAGELIFGGANGFNIFKASQIQNDSSKPLIVLTELQIAGRNVGIAEKIGGNVLLKSALVVTSSIKLHYNQNGFTLAFAALNFFNPQKIRYKYMLEGFDQHWQELGSDNRRAAYTNIDPGEYLFRVRSNDASGNWVDNETQLTITIMPPFWRTNLAYVIYLFTIGGTLLLIRHRGIQRIKKEFVFEQERQQSRRMHDLDLLKIKFLTNVSHEFRTPLSLIITPMEKLIRKASETDKHALQLIHRNGRRLLNLVNQLLDFRTMEEQELKLHPKIGDVIKFIEELSYSFSDVAERKSISLTFRTDIQSLISHFDHDKLERILFNLLSNAFKFTPESGSVKVDIHAAAAEEGQVKLLLQITDTGIGIPEEKQDLIFERFYQHDVPDSMVNQGSGIGLSITREFVRLHGGTLVVESTENEGSCFTVTLFLRTEAGFDLCSDPSGLKVEEAKILSVPFQPVAHSSADRSPAAAAFNWTSKKPVVILVEDNEDFRFYLKDNLREHYQIAEACNGKEGWQKILSQHPDLVVSDVSMPEMNGIDLCKKIKNDKRTAHLPVILLTALTTEDQQLTGLETGASDYLTKPFNFEILLSKIRNQIQQQAVAKKTYQKQLTLKPAESEIESQDQKFIRQLSLNIEQHLADPAYSVDQLSSEMNMSRVGLYKKILPLTGKSPIEYIRHYRLQKAKPLLLKSQLTISEVAYAVGFGNPKHFSRYFKQEFGILPSHYAARESAENINS